VDGVGYCLDCHNERMAQIYGVKRLELFPREFVAEDASGRTHRFVVANLLMGGFSEWSAEEDGVGYRFSIMVDPEDDQEAALRRLHREVRAGRQKQSLKLEDGRYILSNALQTREGQFTLDETGCGRIESSGDAEEGRLIIDGRPVAASVFLRMLSKYEGFNLFYQVKELGDGVLEKDTVLKPISIDAQTILDRFNECLGWFLDGSFISYKREGACFAALCERLDEFELLCRHGDRDVARSVGQALIDRMLALHHDTVDFPDTLIEIVRRSMPKKLPGGNEHG